MRPEPLTATPTVRGVRVFPRVGSGLLGATLVALAVSGCTVNGPDPVPSDPSQASASEVAGPKRPRDLELVAKPEAQLCALLTPDQQTQLDVARPRPTHKDGTNDYPGCAWMGPPGVRTGIDVSVMAVPMSLKDFKDQKLGAGFPETAGSYAVAGGFPVEQAQNGDGNEKFGCSAAVDVAEGQTMWVFTGTLMPGAVSNQQMCDQAKRAAEFAVTTLQG